jgi:hypothetical protein
MNATIFVAFTYAVGWLIHSLVLKIQAPEARFGIPDLGCFVFALLSHTQLVWYIHVANVATICPPFSAGGHRCFLNLFTDAVPGARPKCLFGFAALARFRCRRPRCWPQGQGHRATARRLALPQWRQAGEGGSPLIGSSLAARVAMQATRQVRFPAVPVRVRVPPVAMGCSFPRCQLRSHWRWHHTHRPTDTAPASLPSDIRAHRSSPFAYHSPTNPSVMSGASGTTPVTPTTVPHLRRPSAVASRWTLPSHRRPSLMACPTSNKKSTRIMRADPTPEEVPSPKRWQRRWRMTNGRSDRGGRSCPPAPAAGTRFGGPESWPQVRIVKCI